MPELSTVLVFAAVTAALFVVPGPSVIYIVTRSMVQGRAAGLLSVLGMHVGTVPYVVVTSLGLSALLTTSSIAFQAIKYLGAAYLIWLGVQKLWQLRRGVEPIAEPAAVPMPRVFAEAVVVSVLNPKTLLFHTAFLPQFVDPARGSVLAQVLFFCVGFLVLGVVSDGSYALLSSAFGGRLRRDARHRRRLERSSGIVYVLLGAFAAVVSQP